MLNLNNQKGNATVIVIVIFVLIVALGAYIVNKGGDSEEMEAQKMSQDEAMMEKNDQRDIMMDDDKMENADEMSEVKTFSLNGFDFGYSLDEIRVKKGDKVRIELTSTQGFHDWVVDEFDAATEKVNTGGKTFVEFTADKAGTFEYYCHVGKHREFGMVGNLIVEDDAAMEDDEAVMEDDKTTKATPGSYQEYSDNRFKAAADKKRVYFFHASWCPTCKAADKDLLSNVDNIPDNVVIYKTDYDKEKELKEKYGVTYQHTFVQVDENGNEVAKWNGGDSRELASNIK